MNLTLCVLLRELSSIQGRQELVLIPVLWQSILYGFFFIYLGFRGSLTLSLNPNRNPKKKSGLQ